MTIGQLAKRADVNPQTIRYYEREGILPEPARRVGSDYREYSEATLESLVFIKSAQAAGFKLSQIQEILVAIASRRPDCGKMLELIHERQAEVAEKLRTLRAFQRTLSKLDQACRENVAEDCCPGFDLLRGWAGKGSDFR